MIKKYLLIAIILILSTACNCLAQNNKEIFMFSYFKGDGEDGLHLAYSRDGINWEALNHNKSFLSPGVGEDKLMRDPCIIQGPDNKFHMVWTISWKEKGIGYANSDDLIHWSEQKCIPVMEHKKNARNCWAPEIFYDDSTDKFFIFWSTTITGKFTETSSSGDNGYNHRMYYVTTKDFKKFSKTRLFYDHGFNVIDGTLIKHQNSYILFLKDETRTPPEKNIRIASGNSLISNFSEPSDPITGDYWAEGPTPVKIGKYWIVYFDKYRKHTMGAVRSKNLTNWEDISDKVHFPEGTRHGTVFKVSTELLKKLKKFNP